MSQVRWDVTVRRVPEDTTQKISEADDWVRFTEDGLSADEVAKKVNACAKDLIARMAKRTRPARP